MRGTLQLLFNLRSKSGQTNRPYKKTIKSLVGTGVLDGPKKTNAYHQIITLFVILSGEKRLRFAKSKFCGLSEANKQNRGALATMGSPNEFGWLLL